MKKLCHCGQPLHYTDPKVELLVNAMIERLGEHIRVAVAGQLHRVYLVPRHYIALHGLRAQELPSLGFQEIEE